MVIEIGVGVFFRATVVGFLVVVKAVEITSGFFVPVVITSGLFVTGDSVTNRLVVISTTGFLEEGVSVIGFFVISTTGGFLVLILDSVVTGTAGLRGGKRVEIAI